MNLFLQRYWVICRNSLHSKRTNGGFFSENVSLSWAATLWKPLKFLITLQKNFLSPSTPCTTYWHTKNSDLYSLRTGWPWLTMMCIGFLKLRLSAVVRKVGEGKPAKRRHYFVSIKFSFTWFKLRNITMCPFTKELLKIWTTLESFFSFSSDQIMTASS